MIATPDGLQHRRLSLAHFYVANLAARRTIDCVIASHMLDTTGDHHVGYVSSESLHDVFF